MWSRLLALCEEVRAVRLSDDEFFNVSHTAFDDVCTEGGIVGGFLIPREQIP